MKFNKIIFLSLSLGLSVSSHVWTMQHAEQVDQTGWNDIHKAAYIGDLNTIRELITSGVNVNTPINNPGKPTHGYTALHLAAFNGQLNVICLLVNEFHVDVNTQINNPGQPDHRWTALHFAAVNGKIGAIRLLVKEFHVDVNTPVNNPGQSNHGLTALDIAVINEKNDVINLLVDEFHVDINTPINNPEQQSNGYTVLHIAIECGYIGIIRLLIDKFHSNESKRDFLNTPINNPEKENHGYTALHIAIKYKKSSAIVDLLLQNRADANLKADDGRTVFDMAFDQDDQELGQKLLLAAGYPTDVCIICNEDFKINSEIVRFGCGYACTGHFTHFLQFKYGLWIERQPSILGEEKKLIVTQEFLDRATR